MDQPNGHPAAAPDGSIADSEATRSPARPDGKPLKPKKKKRKTDVSEKRVVLLSNDLFSTKDRTEEEETGVWERKMSSREKRQMRKERMKRKGKCHRATLSWHTVSAVFLQGPDQLQLQCRIPEGVPTAPPMAEIRWNVPPHPEGEWQPRPAGGAAGPEARSTGGPPERGAAPGAGKAEKTSRRAVEWAPPSGLEEDIFSHVGTWDSKDVKAEPVTFGTVPDLSSDFGNGSSLPSAPREEWSAPTASLGVEDAWLSLEDPSELDQTSDWKPPREEWGNWAGEDGALGQEAGQTPMVKKTGRRRGE
ncbi:hypothetical protein ANANG_G00003180 [Anguilla anguilla]|uniref:Uncharacterized protein n=1 Tax=Anguilla anguilla TaxID=7936 RepID=A0A9D3MVU7_ANGAN|nr:hypothetical protein ANANG_G00003180 [Anguilla anguilla]